MSWPPGRPSLCLAGSTDDIHTSHQLRGRGGLQTRGLLASLPMSTPGVRPATDFLSRAPTIAPQHETEKTPPALRSGMETRLSGTLPPDPRSEALRLTAQACRRRHRAQALLVPRVTRGVAVNAAKQTPTTHRRPRGRYGVRCPWPLVTIDVSVCLKAPRLTSAVDLLMSKAPPPARGSCPSEARPTHALPPRGASRPSCSRNTGDQFEQQKPQRRGQSAKPAALSRLPEGHLFADRRLCPTAPGTCELGGAARSSP